MAAIPLLLLLPAVISGGVGCTTTSPPAPASEGAPEISSALEEEERDQEIRDPLLSITGVAFHISRISPHTVIILPQTSFITTYLRDEPFTTTTFPEKGLPANRFRFRFEVNTTPVPPFVLDRDRYLYPELYD